MAPPREWRSLQILSFIASFTCLLATRQRIRDRDDLRPEARLDFASNATSKTVPPAVYNFVHRVAPRQCQLMYFAEFAQGLDKEVFDAALSISYKQTPSAIANFIEEDDGIDAEEWPACKPGALVIDCARTLKPVMWLQQQWALADRLELHANAWYCPWCSTKDAQFNEAAVHARKQLFSGAVAAAGFDAEASAEICQEDVSKPYDIMSVRECMLMKASQMHLDADRQAQLVEELASWWSYKDSDKRKKLVKSNMTMMQQFKRLVSDGFGAKSGSNFLRSMYFSKSVMKSLGFIYNKEKKLCIPLVTKARMTEVVDRVTEEVTSVCDKDKGCQEKSSAYCPEGTSCDCQRPHTPKRALTVFNAVFWVASPLTVAVAAGSFAFVTGGAGAVVPAIWTAGWFPDYIPAVIAMGATSRKWTAECMCFELPCKHDADAGMCVVERTKDTKNSSNPYSWLPGNGLKCARVPGSEDSCEFQRCSDADVQIEQGKGLYGRVGYEGADLYNCANLEGSVESQLTFQHFLPAGAEHGALAKNSAKARALIYDRFEVSDDRHSKAEK